MGDSYRSRTPSAYFANCGQNYRIYYKYEVSNTGHTGPLHSAARRYRTRWLHSLDRIPLPLNSFMYSKASNLAAFSFCKHEHQLQYYSFPPGQVLNNLWMDSKRWLTTVLCSDGLLFSRHFIINHGHQHLKIVWENQYCIGLAWYKVETLSAHCTRCLCA